MNFRREIKFGVSIVLIVMYLGTCCAELRMMMTVFRHGDRYPDLSVDQIIYPENPYINISWFPDSNGGLTMEGKRRAFELGNSLREKYGEWIGPLYSKELASFTSSDYDRTIMTSALVAAGLFPPNQAQRWSPKINWQPIPIRPIATNQNQLYFSGFFCSEFKKLLKKTKEEDPWIVNYNKGMQHLYEYISRHTGGPVDNRVVLFLYLEFLAMKEVGLEIPAWATSIFNNGTLENAAIMEYEFSSWTDDLKRFSGGTWLKEWRDHVNDYVTQFNNNSISNDAPKKKMYFYGAHEINIAGILLALDIYYPHVPYYASAVIFELHEDHKHRFYVKVIHENKGKFMERDLPACETLLCPLETFEEAFAKITPKNLVEQCGELDSTI